MNKTIKVILTFTNGTDPDEADELANDFADVIAKLIGDEVGPTDIPMESWWVEVEADD